MHTQDEMQNIIIFRKHIHFDNKKWKILDVVYNLHFSKCNVHYIYKYIYIINHKSGKMCDQWYWSLILLVLTTSL